MAGGSSAPRRPSPAQPRPPSRGSARARARRATPRARGCRRATRPPSETDRRSRHASAPQCAAHARPGAPRAPNRRRRRRARRRRGASPHSRRAGQRAAMRAPLPGAPRSRRSRWPWRGAMAGSSRR
eukprot:scaffold66406_cov66-Phaeocystis_antarctica.AAC.5